MVRGNRYHDYAHRLRAPGMLLGTLPYTSPEQIQGERVDARTDLFSFGAVLYEMATGTRAFQGETFGAVIGAVLQSVPPPATRLNPALPPALEPIINKALEKNCDLRYQNASAVRTDLQRLNLDIGRDSQGSQSDTESGRTHWVNLAKRLPLPAQRVPVASAMVLALAVSAWFFYPRRGTRTLVAKHTCCSTKGALLPLSSRNSQTIVA